MMVINYSCSFSELSALIDRYNKRSVASPPIPSSVMLTAQEIIRIYGRFLVKARQLQDIKKLNLPPLRTNNSQLAKRTKSSTRTMQRHIGRLQEIGFITKKLFRGTNADFEIWLNPSVLFPAAKDRPNPKHLRTVTKVEKNQASTGPKDACFIRTNCPDTDTSNKGYLERLLIDVESWEKQRCSDTLAVEGLNDRSAGNNAGNLENAGDTRDAATTWINSEAHENAPELHATQPEKPVENPQLSLITGDRDTEIQDQSIPGTRDAAEHPGILTSKNDVEDSRTAALSLYVNLFWNLARNLLYTDVYLSESQVEQAKELIRKLYEPMSDRKMAEFHRQYCERLGLAQRYVSKSPKTRFIPLPHKYFDTNNPHGFIGTKAWYAKQAKRQQTAKADKILRQQIQKYIRNEISQKRSSLTVFRECETRLGKLKAPQLVRQFHAAILDLEANTHLQQSKIY